MTQMQSPMSGNGLGDILERVLDKGVVVAGDVSVSLVGIELLTIRLRLVIASVDKAKEIGINWWETDPALSSAAQNPSLVAPNPLASTRLDTAEPDVATHLEAENRALRGQLAILEKRISQQSAA